jgi:hypothetical protein
VQGVWRLGHEVIASPLKNPTLDNAAFVETNEKIEGRTKVVFALGAYQALRLSRLPARALPERRTVLMQPMPSLRQHSVPDGSHGVP